MPIDYMTILKDNIKFGNETLEEIVFNCNYCSARLTRYKGKDSYPKHAKLFMAYSKHWRIHTYKTCNKCYKRHSILERISDYHDED